MECFSTDIILKQLEGKGSIIWSQRSRLSLEPDFRPGMAKNHAKRFDWKISQISGRRCRLLPGRISQDVSSMEVWKQEKWKGIPNVSTETMRCIIWSSGRKLIRNGDLESTIGKGAVNTFSPSNFCLRAAQRSPLCAD